MTLAELRDQITFEAQIPDNKTMIGWLDATIQEEARSLTSGIKYSELYVSDASIDLTSAGSPLESVALPTDVQHLNYNRVRFCYQGDTTRQRNLIRRTNFRVSNIGQPVYFFQSGRSFFIFPYVALLSPDVLLIDYWKYPITLGTQADTVEILPEALISTLKMRVVARASIMIDAKKFPIFNSLAQAKRVEMLGQVDPGDVNGN